MNDDNTIECREEFGLLTCQFNAQKIVFNAMTQQPMGVNVFVSDNCPWCEPTVQHLNHILKPMGDMVNISVHNDDDLAEKHEVDVFPTTEIGNVRIKGMPNKEDVWNAILSSDSGL